MLIVDYDRLNSLERNKYDVLNALKQFVTLGFAPGLLDVKFQVFEAPLSTVGFVVAVAELLDCHIRQVNHHIVKLSHVC